MENNENSEETRPLPPPPERLTTTTLMETYSDKSHKNNEKRNSRDKAHKFYENNGFIKGSYKFKMKL